MVMSGALLTCAMVIMAAPVESYAAQTQAIRLVRSGDWRDVAERAPATAPVDIEFGGKTHNDGIGIPGYREKFKQRPEAIKSQVCDKAACTECTDIVECWHGKGSWADSGILRVEVPAHSKGKRFVAELWARCVDGGGKWTITKVKRTVTEMGHYQVGNQNGKIKVYHNGEAETLAEGKTTARREPRLPHPN